MSLLTGLSLAGNVLNAFGAAQERKQKETLINNAINELARSFDSQYQGTRKNNVQALRAMTGILGDELGALGGSLGAGAAEAGVYNSSVVAGTLSNQAAKNASLMAQFHRESMSQQLNTQADGKKEIARQKIGMLQGEVAGLRGREDAALGGLGGAFQDLVLSLSGKNRGAAGNGKQNGSLMKPGGGRINYGSNPTSNMDMFGMSTQDPRFKSSYRKGGNL